MIYGRVFLNPPDVGQLTPRLRYKIRWPDTDGSGRAIFRCSFSVEGGGRGGEGDRSTERRSSQRREADRFRGLKYFLPDWAAAGFFKHRWKVVRLVSGFLFFNGPPATVTPVAEGGGCCSWRPVRTKSRSTCHLIPTASRARGLYHAPLLFVRRRSASRDINFLLLSFYPLLSAACATLAQRLKRTSRSIHSFRRSLCYHSSIALQFEFHRILFSTFRLIRSITTMRFDLSLSSSHPPPCTEA